MTQEEISDRLTEIEIMLTNQQKEIDDLSYMVQKQGKMLDALHKQNELLQNLLSQDIVKPQNEETPPPHY